MQLSTCLHWPFPPHSRSTGRLETHYSNTPTRSPCYLRLLLEMLQFFLCSSIRYYNSSIYNFLLEFVTWNSRYERSESEYFLGNMDAVYHCGVCGDAPVFCMGEAARYSPHKALPLEGHMQGARHVTHLVSCNSLSFFWTNQLSSGRPARHIHSLHYPMLGSHGLLSRCVNSSGVFLIFIFSFLLTQINNIRSHLEPMLFVCFFVAYSFFRLHNNLEYFCK